MTENNTDSIWSENNQPITKSYPYKIVKWWSSNNQPTNVTLNVPKEYVKIHKLLESKFVKVSCLPNGILIQPLKEVNEAE